MNRRGEQSGDWQYREYGRPEPTRADRIADDEYQRYRTEQGKGQGKQLPPWPMQGWAREMPRGKGAPLNLGLTRQAPVATEPTPGQNECLPCGAQGHNETHHGRAAEGERMATGKGEKSEAKGGGKTSLSGLSQTKSPVVHGRVSERKRRTLTCAQSRSGAWTGSEV